MFQHLIQATSLNVDIFLILSFFNFFKTFVSFNYLSFLPVVCGTVSRIWNETWLSSFFYKPCNYELFVKQSLNMEMAIVMARVWKTISSCILYLCFHSYIWWISWVSFSQDALLLIKYQDAGMEWIIHLDTDELLHPAGAREYSLRQLLLDVPGNVDMVIFPNYVSETV